MVAPYCPKRGDIVWLTFNPQAGHEQAGHRFALVLSLESYNRKVGLALFCTITSQVKGYPFEVSLPQGIQVCGVVLSDQVKNMDWKAKQTSFCCSVPKETIHEVLNKLGTLIDD